MNPILALDVWKELLESGERPTVRKVAEVLADKGIRTYKNAPPSREWVRKAMARFAEGRELLRQSTRNHWKTRYEEIHPMQSLSGESGD